MLLFTVMNAWFGECKKNHLCTGIHPLDLQRTHHKIIQYVCVMSCSVVVEIVMLSGYVSVFGTGPPVHKTQKERKVFLALGEKRRMGH